jgi:hypothetical protein
MVSIINVLYESVDGFHRFTSPQMPGLCIIVEPDQYALALEDLPTAIALLIEGDFGHRATVNRLETLDDYAPFLPKDNRNKILHFAINR